MSNRERTDIVISLDTTTSMRCCLDNVKYKMKDIIQTLKGKIPGIHLGIIAHGDYDSKKYVIKHMNLTDDMTQLYSFTHNVVCSGSGKTPDEAYELALNYARKNISWRPDSNRVLIVIGDRLPHEKDFPLNEGKIDWKEEIKELREMNVKIYSVQCLKRPTSDDFYQTIASSTFGDHRSLDDFSEIKDVIMSISFREAGLEEELNQEYMNKTDECIEISQNGESMDEFEMQCELCNSYKPQDEFPSVTVSECCEHYPGICLRCVVHHVHANKTCPQPNCTVNVDPTCEQVQFCEMMLDQMFLDYAKVVEENRKKMSSSEGNKITVFSMSGDTAWVDYTPNMSVSELMETVEQQTKIKVAKQTIQYKGIKLQTNKSATKPFLLSDYGIGPHESLTLLVPLYYIPDDLDEVVFDLSWELPKETDFLDASCLAFKGKEFIQVIDWNHPTNEYFLKGAINHSQRNKVTVDRRVGHQTIQVSLKKVPKEISRLYFTLSSWKSPNLSLFFSPSLEFYPKAERGNNLCETTFSHALNSQAVVMCSVVRRDERWLIFDCDEDSCVDGNSKKYNPIRKKIVELIAKDE